VAKGKINMNAFNKSMNTIEKAFVERLDKIEIEFKSAMKDMESEAITAAPSDTGNLKSSIKSVEVGRLSYELRADANYAAYVEFGTGYQTVIKNYDEFWQSIGEKFWTRRPNDGVKATPFFYPTVNKNVPKLKKRIKSILSKNA
jgi:HK97 gp10 family phage protein